MSLTRPALVAESRDVRRRLAVFQKRKARPRQATNITRVVMISFARLVDWRDALVIVKPETFIQWHRDAFRRLWRWKSRRRGRPPLPTRVAELIREMAASNPTGGRGKNRGRVAVETRHSGFAANRPQIHRALSATKWHSQTAVDHFRSESRQGNCRLRLHGVGDRVDA